ncbi:MAG: UDP-N-acetylglucosamine 1-carboxyvinyltransferase [marine benthic group bacterium]|jgi:UDP-N-acetylglucosamine 1-carboxyvinyltransferase|nr:UDP-N-acetylglucosamine 1-carboxyvinyltransferase [Candidatus Benthicola marisminoris]
MHYRIEGPASLGGRFTPAGNKNAALPILAGSLLADAPVVLDNVPDIRDVRTLVELMSSIGASVDWEGNGRVVVDPSGVTGGTLDPDLSRRIRASILLAGPLLARSGQVVLPPPGGDVIGRRRLDTHFLALGRLGAEVEVGDRYELRARRLVGADVFLDEPSVTGTENAILAAVTAEGTTRLRNAAAEPHVQDLCRFLASMGADIEGLGTHDLTIRGVESLSGTTHRIGADHIEIGSVVGLAAITGSEVVIEDVEAQHMDPLRVGFERLGVRCELRGSELHVPAEQSMEIQPDLGDQVPSLGDGPWPAFPADLMSIALVVATRCRGTILIHEKMFESRMYFADKVISMGGRVVLCDPHRAVVVGPSHLRGSRVESPDIRAGMALLIAALAADGVSRIHNIGQIERGYERIDERLRELGAAIERVEDDC